MYIYDTQTQKDLYTFDHLLYDVDNLYYWIVT